MCREIDSNGAARAMSLSFGQHQLAQGRCIIMEAGKKKLTEIKPKREPGREGCEGRGD